MRRGTEWTFDRGDETVGALAEQLDLRHHSAVGLIDRAEEKGLVRRRRFSTTRTYVRIELTANR